MIITRIDYKIATNYLNSMILVSFERQDSQLLIHCQIVIFKALDPNLQSNWKDILVLVIMLI